MKPLPPYHVRFETLLKKASIDASSLDPHNITSPLPIAINTTLGLWRNDCLNSLAIDGFKMTDRVIEGMGLSAVKASQLSPKILYPVLAAKGYKRALDQILIFVQRSLAPPAFVDLIQDNHLKLHSLMQRNLARNDFTVAESGGRYRPASFFVRHSSHISVPPEVIPELMSVFFSHLRCIESGFAQGVMSHLALSYLSPYADGNGRFIRLIMNALFSNAGFPWLIVRREYRREYMRAILNSTDSRDISPITRFLFNRKFVAVHSPFRCRSI